MGIQVQDTPASERDKAGLPDFLIDLKTANLTRDDLLDLIKGEVKGEMMAGFESRVAYQDKQLDAMLTKTREHCAETAVKYQAPKPTTLIFKVENHEVQFDGEFVNLLVAELVLECQMSKNHGQWPYVVGPTRCGKTHMADQVARAQKLPLVAITLDDGMSMSAFYGNQTVNGFVESEVLLGWAGLPAEPTLEDPTGERFKNGALIFFDEIDNGSPNAVNAAGTLIANDTVFNIKNGKTYKRHPGTKIMAAGNTAGGGATSQYTASNKLALSTRKRFVYYYMTYSQELEERFCPTNHEDSKKCGKALREHLWACREKLTNLKAKDALITSADVRTAYVRFINGVKLPDIFANVTTGWPSDIIEQSGMTAKGYKEFKASQGA